MRRSWRLKTNFPSFNFWECARTGFTWWGTLRRNEQGKVEDGLLLSSQLFTCCYCGLEWTTYHEREEKCGEGAFWGRDEDDEAVGVGAQLVLNAVWKEGRERAEKVGGRWRFEDAMKWEDWWSVTPSHIRTMWVGKSISTLWLVSWCPGKSSFLLANLGIVGSVDLLCDVMVAFCPLDTLFSLPSQLFVQLSPFQLVTSKLLRA